MVCTRTTQLLAPSTVCGPLLSESSLLLIFTKVLAHLCLGVHAGINKLGVLCVLVHSMRETRLHHGYLNIKAGMPGFIFKTVYSNFK